MKMKRISYISLAASLVGAGCGGAANVSVNVPADNRPVATPTVALTANDNSPAPSSTQPVASPAPSASNHQVPGPTPLGTPSKANATGERPARPGTTPTPGIPSPEELRKFMSDAQKKDPNAPSTQAPPMMKSNRPLGGRMSSNSNKP